MRKNRRKADVMGRNQRCRRRRLIVHKEGQKKIILAVALLPSLSLAVAAMIIAVFCRKLLGEASRLEAVLPSLLPLFLSILGFMVLSGLIVFHQAVTFSNKVWGPCYRLMVAFNQVKAGDLDCRIKLRDGDHLTEVTDAFNELVDWLDEHPPAGLDEVRALAAGENTTAESTDSSDEQKKEEGELASV